MFVALSALVFAAAGGAFATTGGGGGSHLTFTASTAKSKPKSKTGPRGPAGPKGATGTPGPAGATGLAGPAGASGAKGETGPAGPTGPTGKGEKGEPGTNGTNGANGKSVLAEEEAKAPGSHCKEGGSNFEVEGSGVKTYACNGGSGAGGGGLPKTLGAGETETGSWTAQVPPKAEKDERPATAFSSISFPIQLKAALDATKVIFLAPESTGHEAECPGTVAQPAAKTGYLCVYTTKTTLAEPEFGVIHPPSSEEFFAQQGTARTGALLTLSVQETAPGSGKFEETGGFAFGTWAVTG
jgi:hypothetical protein